MKASVLTDDKNYHTCQRHIHQRQHNAAQPIAPPFRGLILSESAPLPSDAINTLISDAEYNHAIETTEPAIYSGALYGFRLLFYNIRVNGVFVARICVDEVVSPLTDRDFALIKILGHYLGKGLAAERVYSFSRPKDMDNILHSLLSHRLIPEKKSIMFWRAAAGISVSKIIRWIWISRMSG